MSLLEETFEGSPSLTPAEEQAHRMIEFVNVELPHDGQRIITLTSSAAGEDSSQVSWEFARAIARATRTEVLYVGATLGGRSPDGDEGGLTDFGLTDFFLSKCNIVDLVRPSKQAQISLLLPGESDRANLGSVLDVHVEKGFQALRSQYQYVVVDAPPPSVSHFTLMLTRHSDGVMVVVESGVTDKHVVAETVDVLRTNARRLLGVVFSRTP